jgi:hypothetical protein
MPDLLREVLDGIHAIMNEKGQAEALAALVPYPSTLLPKK